MAYEFIPIEHAFDPEARQAQQDFDRYLEARPGPPEVVELAETPGTGIPDPQGVSENITASFDRQVIEHQPQGKPQRVGMMLDDIRDNQVYERPVYAATCEGPEAAVFTTRLLPVEAQQAIRRIGQHYPDGTMSRRIDHVGKEKTYHPHYYFIDRTKPGTTRMYFVDPEHKVAANSIVRPSIVNLVGIEVPDDETVSPQVAILRYQVPKYDPKDKPKGLGHNDLKDVIEEVLDNGGALPELLTGDAEHGVLFMLAGNNEVSRAQGRYSTKKQLNSFVKGGTGSSALEGKVHVNEDVLNKLIRLFNQPSQARVVGKITLHEIPQ